METVRDEPTYFLTQHVTFGAHRVVAPADLRGFAAREMSPFRAPLDAALDAGAPLSWQSAHVESSTSHARNELQAQHPTEQAEQALDVVLAHTQRNVLDAPHQERKGRGPPCGTWDQRGGDRFEATSFPGA